MYACLFNHMPRQTKRKISSIVYMFMNWRCTAVPKKKKTHSFWKLHIDYFAYCMLKWKWITYFSVSRKMHFKMFKQFDSKVADKC